eukprot:scaffold18299_cov117-Isochrysis_galbana.AAC.9
MSCSPARRSLSACNLRAEAGRQSDRVARSEERSRWLLAGAARTAGGFCLHQLATPFEIPGWLAVERASVLEGTAQPPGKLRI